MNIEEAFLSLGVTRFKNDLSRTYRLNKNKFYNSKAARMLKKRQSNPKLWGVYSLTQPAAKFLAVMTGAHDAPEVHKPMFFGHYHDSRHLIHIWYGSAVLY